MVLGPCAVGFSLGVEWMRLRKCEARRRVRRERGMYEYEFVVGDGERPRA